MAVALGGAGGFAIRAGLFLVLGLGAVTYFGWNNESRSARMLARAVVVVTVLALVILIPLLWWYFSHFKLTGM